MNKIKIIITFIFITIIYTLFAYAENEGWDVKLDIIKDKFLPAEPIIITIQATNNSNKEIRGFSATGHLFLDEKICNQQHAVIQPATPPCPTCSGGTPKLYKPNENIIMNIRLNYICYGLWVDNSVEASFGSHKFCYKDDNREICKNFEIIHPIGEDEGAYKWLQSNGIRDLYESTKLDYILEKYPTSTYAGWALANKYSGASFIYNTGKEMVDDLSLSDEERKINNARLYKRKNLDNPGWISPIPIAQEYLRIAEPFIKHHADFALSSIIYINMGLAYMVLHRWQEAYNALDKALSLGIPKDWPEQYERIIKEVKEELLKRGWAK